MADWSTNKPSSAFSAGGKINEFVNKRSQLIDHGTKKIYVSNFGKDSVVGINVRGIPRILVKLKEYREAVEEEIKKLNTSLAKSENAIKSAEIREELQNYFVTVKDNLNALVSQLNAFGDKLADVTDQYQAFAKGQGAAIKSFNDATKAPELYTMQNTNYGTGGSSAAQQPTIGGHGQGENAPQNLQTIQDLDQ